MPGDNFTVTETYGETKLLIQYRLGVPELIKRISHRRRQISIVLRILLQNHKMVTYDSHPADTFATLRSACYDRLVCLRVITADSLNFTKCVG